MIVRYGRAGLGPRLYTIEEFFAVADDDYCFAPNLEPHPSLAVIREAIERLCSNESVVDILVEVVDLEDGVPTSDGIVVRSTSSNDFLQGFATTWGAELIEAPENTVRKLGATLPGQNVWKVIWD
jgi:hypothetical protein